MSTAVDAPGPIQELLHELKDLFVEPSLYHLGVLLIIKSH
jgi:hypothetical protein